MQIKSCTIENGLRIERGTNARDVLGSAAFFAGDADAVEGGLHEIITLSAFTFAVNTVFFRKITENEKHHIAQMLINAEIILICLVNAGKLGVINDGMQFVIGKLDSLHHLALCADEKNINTRIGAREREKLSCHQEFS